MSSETGSDTLLKVLSGALGGASLTLKPGEETYIGHGFRNDVVLRDKDLKQTRMRLVLTDGIATIDVLSGEAELLGQLVTAPATITLPDFTPLWIGNTAMAFGEAGSARWTRCDALMAKRGNAVVSVDAGAALPVDQEDRFAGPQGWLPSGFPGEKASR